MADLYTPGNTSDGLIGVFNQSTWAAARDSASGLAAASTSFSNAMTHTAKLSGRGGGFRFNVIRSFFFFDTSGITGNVSSATLKIYGFSNNNGSIIAVKSFAFLDISGNFGSLGNFDKNKITGYSAGASLDGNATDYSTAITSGWSTSGYNDLASTADLRADMQNDDEVIICVMDFAYDYRNIAPSSSGDNFKIGGFFTDNPGTSKDPYIEYEIATGYGNDVMGVASANISKINEVATANIEKVIGV